MFYAVDVWFTSLYIPSEKTCEIRSALSVLCRF